MPTQHPASAQPALSLEQLRGQLAALVDVCEALESHLERQRELATRRGAGDELSRVEQALLQVARVRNEVRTACRDLDATTTPSATQTNELAAA
jgi:hypothetical protein